MTNQNPICVVCAGQGTGVSVGEYPLCNDPRCADVAKAWRVKGVGGLSNIEGQAIELAGKSGGSFLMNELAGKTDLAKMTPQEWLGFVTALIKSYRAELQRLSDDGIPF